MYLIENVTEKVMEKATRGLPVGPGIPEEIAVRAVRMEIFGTSLAESGKDFAEFRLYDKKGNIFYKVKVNGY